jgi:D-glycero-D-manno-heptose 1,7-bisphosphate phosphatase
VIPAVFLDRDGTMLEEAGYLDRLDKVAFFPYATDAVRLLNRGGYKVIVITNQSGVGRGMYSEEFVRRTHELMTARLAAGGARVDGYYYCPHHPDSTLDRYRIDCDCRKPAPGMLRQAASELRLDLSRSFTVGDKWTDVAVGAAAGAKGILVRTGYGQGVEAAPPAGIAPAFVADNVAAAVAWILRQS